MIDYLKMFSTTQKMQKHKKANKSMPRLYLNEPRLRETAILEPTLKGRPRRSFKNHKKNRII